MQALAFAVGYFVLVSLTAGFFMFVINYLACTATQAYCLIMGAYHLGMYRHNWSRMRMFLWAWWKHIKACDLDAFTSHHTDGRFVSSWRNWNDWTYAGRK